MRASRSPQGEWIARADQRNLTSVKRRTELPWVIDQQHGAGRFGSEIEEAIMVLVLIDTVTGTRRTILVPVKACPQPSAPAPILTHPHFTVHA